MTSFATITVFGGTGYLGRQVVGMLADAGHPVRVAVRRPQSELFHSRQVQQLQADVRDAAAVASAIDGAAAVINAVGLYIERGNDTFQAIHVDGAGRIAEQAAASGARLIHVSGIGASETSASRYVRARAAGERRIHKHCPEAVILRPSVLFGEDDKFLCALAKLIRVSPVVPLFGDGGTRLQPVYVNDVAKATFEVVADADIAAGVYELGGPDVYTYRELIDILTNHLGRRRIMLPVSFTLWEAQAALASLLPNPPFTRDQLELMRQDNTVAEASRGFPDLHVEPQSLKTLLSRCVPR